MMSDADIPENFEEWPKSAKVQFIQGVMTKQDILREVVEAADCDDQDVIQALSKEQAAEVYLALRELTDQPLK